jgi:hypothetical protein
MPKARLLTLLTDFGAQDAYVAAMKGVILRVCPRAQIVDIAHELPAHDVLAAAMVLAEAAPCFPPDTLHVVVVDPGVGTDRAILVGRFGDQWYLFPDNGVITFVAERAAPEALHVVSGPAAPPPAGASATFHGRDVFAPLAGRILEGLDPRRLGPQPAAYKLLDVPACRQQDDALIGQVVYVDRFGNLVSNIRRRQVQQWRADLDRLRVRCAGRDVGGIRRAYGFVPEGQAVALLNSMGLLEVAVNCGRAADVLDAGVGAPVRVVDAGLKT